MDTMRKCNLPGKVFRTWADANRALAKVRTPNIAGYRVTVYKCRSCGEYHIGGSVKKDLSLTQIFEPDTGDTYRTTSPEAKRKKRENPWA